MNGIMERSASLTRSGGNLKTNWKQRPMSQRHPSEREIHVLALETEVTRLRQILSTREESNKIIQEISSRLYVLAGELDHLFIRFREARGQMLGLTTTQMRVHQVLLQRPGWSQKEIAAELKMNVRTVKFHISAILLKAGVRSRHEL